MGQRLKSGVETDDNPVWCRCAILAMMLDRHRFRRHMSQLFAKFALFLTILSFFGVGDLFSKADAGVGHEWSAGIVADHDLPAQESPSDCDSESCADHRCHIGHCSFFIPARFALLDNPFPVSEHTFSAPNRLNPFAFVQGILEPPRV